MPDYEDHLWLAKKVGFVVGLILAFVTFVGGVFDHSSPGITSVGVLSGIIGLIGYYSTLVGGAAPDIDLSRPTDSLVTASIPYRKLVKSLQLLVSLIVLFGYTSFVDSRTVVAQAGGAIVAGSFVIITVRLIPDILHRMMPVHRTTTHSLGFWMIIGLLSIFTTHQIVTWFQGDSFINTYISMAIGVPIFLGAFTHASMDTVNNYVRDYAPEPVKRKAAELAPWVPKHKPVLSDIPQLGRIAFDKTAPFSIRIFVVFTALYGIMPLDLISDFIPLIGWTDDLGIYLGLREAVYSGYYYNEGIIDTFRREMATAFKIYVPVLLLTLFVVFISVFFMV